MSNLNYRSLGKTLLIINPVSQSGRCRSIGHQVFGLLKDKYQQDVDMFFTEHAGHASDIAKKTYKYDTVIAVGGDGVVHEIVSGLMLIEKTSRPTFGVVPVGSGNDYARSLGMSFKVSRAVEQIMMSKIRVVDVGKCNDRFFCESLSFGLDAGIAIDTVKAREKTREKGFKLYFKCGIDRIKNNFDFFNFKIVFPDKSEISGNSLIFAVLNGPTYGGGFLMAPQAKIDDGYLDIAYTKGKFNRAIGLSLFARISQGRHKNSKRMKFHRFDEFVFKADRKIPCQMDGEEYSSDSYNIKILPLALQVYESK